VVPNAIWLGAVAVAPAPMALETHKSEIVVEDDAAVQRLARPLIAKYCSPDKPKNGLNGADPFVIAQAQKNSPHWIVVSGEKGDQNNPKIGYIKCLDFAASGPTRVGPSNLQCFAPIEAARLRRPGKVIIGS
jgi:hypothetical protein